MGGGHQASGDRFPHQGLHRHLQVEIHQRRPARERGVDHLQIAAGSQTHPPINR